MRISGDVRFFCDEDEFSGVKKIAGKVCLDVERVTGKKPEVSTIAGARKKLFFLQLLVSLRLQKSLLQKKVFPVSFQKSAENASVIFLP